MIQSQDFSGSANVKVSEFGKEMHVCICLESEQTVVRDDWKNGLVERRVGSDDPEGLGRDNISKVSL